jgi:hypothetical protein
MCFKQLFFIIFLFLSAIVVAQNKKGWANMCAGKDLSGWKVLGGKG